MSEALPCYINFIYENNQHLRNQKEINKFNKYKHITYGYEGIKISEIREIPIIAEVNINNIASNKVFNKVGFEKIDGAGQKNQNIYAMTEEQCKNRAVTKNNDIENSDKNEFKLKNTEEMNQEKQE